MVKSLLFANLAEILDIFLENKPEIPLNGCVSSSLIKVAKSKAFVLKTFNHLTDVLNNPEHSIFAINSLIKLADFLK